MSLRNFVHYLALRQFDVRKLQLDLAETGLSSLGRAEGYVMENLNAVLRALRCTQHLQHAVPRRSRAPALSCSMSERLLHQHTRAIFGPKPRNRHVYIMVTAPLPDIATSQWFDQMLSAGMNSIRINSAHGTAADWQLLCERARDSSQRLNLPLKIVIDLAGPKLRTKAFESGPRVMKIKPLRDDFGRIMTPGRIWLSPQGGASAAAADGGLRVCPEVFKRFEPGDRLKLTDARGKKRQFKLSRLDAEDRLVAETGKTTYFTEGTHCRLIGADGKRKVSFLISGIPPRQFRSEVAIGECVVLSNDAASVPAAFRHLVAVGCTMPEILGELRSGMTVMLDDGKICTRVLEEGAACVVLRIERASKGKAVIRGDMGINLPDMTLPGPALSVEDAETIKFATAHADIIALSFIRTSDDVRSVLGQIDRHDLGIILKIETRSGFESLPTILLENLGQRDLAVMIARGDLAVECGFDRLAEIQEEILWLSEACHVPVIWATQVLESLAKTGFPSRAEVTDAAMSVRAECVMLNKGPFIESAIQPLDSILVRMEAHQFKKRQLYRPLHLPVPSFIRSGTQHFEDVQTMKPKQSFPLFAQSGVVVPKLCAANNRIPEARLRHPFD